MTVVTTLGFNGRTEEALAYYREVLGAETVFLMRFRDSPDPSQSHPGLEDKIFHATFRIDGTELMASDVGCGDVDCGDNDSATEFTGFALALQFNSLDRAKQVFKALSAEGQIVLPLAPSAFTSWYAIVTDRFGVTWKLNVINQQPE